MLLVKLRNGWLCSHILASLAKAGWYRGGRAVNQRAFSQSRRHLRPGQRFLKKFGALVAASSVLIAGTCTPIGNQLVGCSSRKLTDDIPTCQVGDSLDGLPEYSKEDLHRHRTKDTGIWVTYKNGVYDVTDFVEGHPGGESILLAAGASIEPFWKMYATHHKEEVYNMLEDMRIGNIKITKHEADDNVLDPYANEPKRHPEFRINSLKPFDADCPVDLILDNFVTPNEIFFVRNHLPVPVVDAENYRLVVEIEGGSKLHLTLNELKRKFEQFTVMSTIQCTGNRRDEMSAYKKINGTGSGLSQISNAVWKGVRLSDVLEYAGLCGDHHGIAHVQFEGLDKDIAGDAYAASIPIEIALNRYRDVILAYEMNGEVLPRDHGYPLRVVVPGVVGARNVKWLSRVYASKNESPSHWQQNDYKSFCPSVDWKGVDFSTSPAIQDGPVQSAIMYPKEGDTIVSNEVNIRGYAWSGGGHGIVRVDVSIDGGHTWTVAALTKPKQRLGRTWAWTFWDVIIPVPKDHSGKLVILCKAVDTAHNTQPDSLKAIWNLKGVLNNCWHRINVTVD